MENSTPRVLQGGLKTPSKSTARLRCNTSLCAGALMEFRGVGIDIHGRGMRLVSGWIVRAARGATISLSPVLVYPFSKIGGYVVPESSRPILP